MSWRRRSGTAARRCWPNGWIRQTVIEMCGTASADQLIASARSRNTGHIRRSVCASGTTGHVQ
jgi:hypothetical protein